MADPRVEPTRNPTAARTPAKRASLYRSTSTSVTACPVTPVAPKATSPKDRRTSLSLVRARPFTVLVLDIASPSAPAPTLRRQSASSRLRALPAERMAPTRYPGRHVVRPPEPLQRGPRAFRSRRGRDSDRALAAPPAGRLEVAAPWLPEARGERAAARASEHNYHAPANAHFNAGVRCSFSERRSQRRKRPRGGASHEHR